MILGVFRVIGILVIILGLLWVLLLPVIGAIVVLAITSSYLDSYKVDIFSGAGISITMLVVQVFLSCQLIHYIGTL